jgi:hypothetical protein
MTVYRASRDDSASKKLIDGGLRHPVTHGGDGEAPELGLVFRNLKTE